MKDCSHKSDLMSCKLSVSVSTKMTYPGHKTSSLRRSQSLSHRPRFSECGRSEVSPDVPRVRRPSIGEETTHFYVLQPKPGLAKPADTKVQYPHPVVTLRRESSPVQQQDENSKFTKHKTVTDSAQLSPKSILKNFTAASYRNPVLTPRTGSDEDVIKQPSCLRSRANDTKGPQPSPRGNFRYRLSRAPPSSAPDKKVTFDEQVSYINDNNLYRRRHSTPSLPLL